MTRAARSRATGRFSLRIGFPFRRLRPGVAVTTRGARSSVLIDGVEPRCGVEGFLELEDVRRVRLTFEGDRAGEIGLPLSGEPAHSEQLPFVTVIRSITHLFTAHHTFLRVDI